MALLIALVLYAGGAALLGAAPVNADFTPTADGPEFCVRSTAMHSDFVLPAANAVIDWRTQHPPAHFPRRQGETRYLAFGWGDRRYYLESATQGGPASSTPLAALAGLGEAALHVEAAAAPLAGDETVCTRVSEAQYRALAGYIRDSFKRDASGAVMRIDAPGYGTSDAFYEAQGTLSLFVTCNEWVRRGLSASGVRAPAWSPFDGPLLRQLRAAGAAD